MVRAPILIIYSIVARVSRGLRPDVTSSDLQVRCVVPSLWVPCLTILLQGQLAMETNSRSTFHPDYALLAGRVFVDRIHRVTKKRFSDWVTYYGTGESAVSASSLLTSSRYRATCNSEA